MKEHLLTIAKSHVNLLARQRAKRALRLRYGLTFSPKPRPDPIWLSAHD